jgi:hypothetical protein
MCQKVAQEVAHLPRIAVNNTYLLASDADILYASDMAWWVYHSQEALKFKGLKVTAQDCVPFRAVNYLVNTGKKGFDANPENIRTGGNSGYAAIHLAIQAGASRVLLFGFDIGGKHWHDDHVTPLRNPKQQTFDMWLDCFQTLADDVKGVCEVINCTPNSRLTCFPYASFSSIKG